MDVLSTDRTINMHIVPIFLQKKVQAYAYTGMPDYSMVFKNNDKSLPQQLDIIPNRQL